MASRDKKLSIARKQSAASPIPPKDPSIVADSPKVDSTPPVDAPPTDHATNKVSTPKTPVAPKTARNRKRLVAKRGLRVNLKPRNTRKISQRLARALVNNAKNNFDVKKAILLKSAIKPVLRKATKVTGKSKNPAPPPADEPPVLEPILPLEVAGEEKKPKRANKRMKKTSLSEETKDATTLSSIDRTINSILSQITDETKLKTKTKRKAKCEPGPNSVTETIEDVISDLTSLIKGGDWNSDTQTTSNPDGAGLDDVTTCAKTEGAKPKRNVRKKTVEPLKKQRVMKKENIDNTKLLDILDLNVRNRKVVNPIAKRRHSIEQFAINNSENESIVNNVFSNLGKIETPRKRARNNPDTFKRLSPYTTRSETPTRVLRNGKHRKLRENLLDGLNITIRKRRRYLSDYSGSEKSVSKMSGYESDSSFSDFASPQGQDQNESRSSEIKSEAKPADDVEVEKESTTTTVSIIKRSPSSEAATNGIDVPLDPSDNNNSNERKEETGNKLPLPVVATKVELPEPEPDNTPGPVGTPSVKVPDKPFILDSMKQVFNDVSPDDGEKRATRSTTSTNKLLVADHADSIARIKVEPADKAENGANTDLTQSKEVVAEVEQTPSATATTTTDVAAATSDKTVQIEETPEELAIKENILQALGLQSLRAAEEAKLKVKEKTSPKSDYTGTLKTVIKVNRYEKKKGRNTLKFTLQKHRGKGMGKDGDDGGLEMEAKQGKEGGSSWRTNVGQSSDTAGAHRKSHYSNRSNMDGSSEHTSDGDGPLADGEEKETLVIPEKASSFSIHPGRLCKDECSYCFGKFGLFDTPCHIAQIKSVETQNKVLAFEKHLTKDSCLCDACYRHVARRTTNSFSDKLSKRNMAPGPRQNHCHVLGCKAIASNILRRKWLMKMRKRVCEVINIDLANPGLHSIPICADHYKSIEHLMECVMCKRNFARNHLCHLGVETDQIMVALKAIGLCITMVDKPVVCKLCRYFATLLIKSDDERPESSAHFIKQYKRRLLELNDIEVPEIDDDDEPPPKEKEKEKEKQPPLKKRKRKSRPNSPPVLEPQVELTNKPERIPAPPSETTSTEKSRSESPSDYMFDYQTLVPNIAIECEPDNRRERSLLKTIQQRPESVKEAVHLSKHATLQNNNHNGRNSIQRLGSNPSISVRQLFPGEEAMGVHGHIEFNNPKERTAEGWEKCTSTIQYDYETKVLWHELQKPYGNQSSFLRHLILLEKYFRNGDLVLAPHASHHSINYSESVQNRLRAYDNAPSLSLLPATLPNVTLSVKKSSSGIITTTKEAPNLSMINAANIPKNTPITISQIKSMSPVKAKHPPGLISLHSSGGGSSSSSTGGNGGRPAYKSAQTQKIKIPLTKNWRPTLIPIDPSRKNEDRKPGFVKVISTGKPYYITLDDYNRMCAIKKSFDLKQKRMQEQGRLLANGSAVMKASRKLLPKPATLTGGKSDSILKESNDGAESNFENSLDKLDKAVEKLEMRLTEINLPKIPKSLTVIPQTVKRKSFDLPMSARSPPLPVTNKS